MNTTTTFLIILCFVFLTGKAQRDTTLPAGKATIHLLSGKKIKNIQLWKIDSLKTEFIKAGNLADVHTPDISIIETPSFAIVFDENYRPQLKDYDIIVISPPAEDTIRCFIKGREGNVIRYTPPGSSKARTVFVTSVQYYTGQENYAKPEPMKAASAQQTSNIQQFGIIEKEPVLTGEQNVKAWESRSASDNPALFYHSSYQRGVTDAQSQYNAGGWGAGGFCLGATCGFPLLSIAAPNTEGKCDYTPPGVDPTLYKKGYESQAAKKRVKAASTGGLIALGTAVMIGLILVFNEF